MYHQYQYLNEGPFEVNLSNILATPNEVLDLLQCIDESKATGPDGISPKMLKEAGNSIVASLTLIYVYSMQNFQIHGNLLMFYLYTKREQHLIYAIIVLYHSFHV